MSEFIDDLQKRIITGLTEKLGVTEPTAGMVASEIIIELCRDWQGDRPFIVKGPAAEKQRSERNRALLRDWSAGERIPFLARRYGISTKRVYCIIKNSRALPN